MITFIKIWYWALVNKEASIEARYFAESLLVSVLSLLISITALTITLCLL